MTLLIISSESWNPEELPASLNINPELCCVLFELVSLPLGLFRTWATKTWREICTSSPRSSEQVRLLPLTQEGIILESWILTVLTHFLLQVVCCWTTVRKVLLMFSTAGRTAALSSPWATCCRPSQSWKRRKTSSWRSTREFVNPHRHTHTVHN